MLTLETERLILRPFAAEDIDAYAAMCADAEVMRFMGDRGVLAREDAWRQLAMLAGHWSLRGYGMWALQERATGAFIGRAGLHYPEGWPDREVAWALARPFWGRGLACEAARAALSHAFGVLDWDRAVSLIDPGNSRSARLAERLGMAPSGTVQLRGHTVGLYRIDRGSWEAREAVRRPG